MKQFIPNVSRPLNFEIPRGVLIQRKKKRKKKNVTRAKKTRGCNDYPHQELHVYRYTYIHTKRTVRWNPLSVRIYTMLDEKKRRWVYLVARNATLKYCREPRI